MAKQISRNRKIDLLRFIFSICVVLNHAKHAMPDKSSASLFSGYSFGVEFFFLVSGYLLMATIEKAEKSSTMTLGRETGALLVKKFKALYPEALISYILGFVITCVAATAEPVTLFFKTWFEIPLLLSSGLNKANIMPAAWYVSSMILCMALLYPLVRKYKDFALRIILPAIILLLSGYLYQTYGTVRGPLEWTGLTMKGNYRAIVELSLGMICYCVTKKLKVVDFTLLGRILLTLVEWAIYIQTIYYMATDADGLKDFFYIALLSIAIIISFSEKSLGSALFNNRVCAFLGKYSLSIYFSHYVFAKRLGQLFPQFNDFEWKQRLAVYLATSLFVGLIVMAISAAIRKYGPKLAGGAKRLVIKQRESIH